MRNEFTSRELIAGGAETPAPSGSLEVLYVDADAAVRERTRATMADQRADVSVAGVGTVEAALDVAQSTPPSCLVVDPTGLDDIQALLSAVDAPVIVYTDQDPAQLSDTLAEVMLTVVEKGATERGAFLAEKVISVADTTTARSEYALQQALEGVSSRAETGQATFLVDDEGTIQWSSTALPAFLGATESHPTEDLYEQLAALCDEPAGVTAIEEFRADPAGPATVQIDGRHFLLQQYRPDAVPDSLRLVLLRDVTEAAGRDARLSMLELLTEQAQDGLYTLDERGIIDFCNESFARNLGYAPEELRGEHAETTLAPGELEKGQRTIAELLDADEESTTVDLTFQRKDGTEREISIHYTLLRDKDGDYSGLMGVTRDITERLDRERELERRKELFDGLVDHFPNGGVFLFDDDLRYTMAGGDELERLDLTAEEVVGRRPPAVFPEESAERLEAAQWAALDGETSSFHEPIADRHYEIQTIPIHDGGGEVASGMLLAQNVTERVRRERQLEQSNTLLSTLFDALPVGILVEDRKRGVLTVNQRFVDLIDLPATPEDVVGADPIETARAMAEQFEDPEGIVETVKQLPEERERSLQEQTELSDGRVYQRSYLPIELPSGPANIWLCRDITERLERERELAETTERLELALEGAQLGVWDWNIETGHLTFDARWAGMLGHDQSDLEDRVETWERLVHPDDIEDAWAAIDAHLNEETEMLETEYRMRSRSGEYRWIRDIGRVVERAPDGSAVRAVGVHQDITERKERQQEIEAQRDELATLAQIHVLIQDVIRALGSAATRAEIEEMVCDRIVESNLYQFAWVGEREGSGTRLARRTADGVDDSYLDIIEGADGSPGRMAIQTGEPQVVDDVVADERVDGWRDAALDRGFRSSLVVPLRQDEALHGVLAVYASREDAFSERAVEAFTVLGELVGFAFTAVQNRQLLSQDHVFEMEFRTRSLEAYPMAIADEHDCVFRQAGGVDLGDQSLEYIAVEGEEPETVFEDMLAHDLVVDGRIIRTDDDGGVIELRSLASYQSMLLDLGVRTLDIVADGDTVRIKLEAPADADPRTIQETLAEHAPGFELVAKQERDRAPTSGPDQSSLREELTERQREILRAAYLAGYYEWPRDTNAEQLADSLDIASSTLHQHLRRAERNLLDELLDI